MKLLLSLLALTCVALAQNPNTAAYPGTVATDRTLGVAQNNAASTLSTGIDASTLTIPVANGSLFLQYGFISIDSEIMQICSISSNVLTACSRGADGTVAASHSAARAVRSNINRWYVNQLGAEVKAIENFVGTSPLFAASSLPYLLASEFDFSPDAAGGSLTGGIANTVLLNPGPRGVAGSDIYHDLYISGGIGTPEAARITGGTCDGTGTQASCTVVFTPSNGHTGGWTVQSATSGIVEAQNFLPVTGGKILLPRGIVNIYGTLYLGKATATTQSPLSAVGLVGQGSGIGGEISSLIVGATSLKWAGAAGGTVVKVMGPISNVTIEDVQIDCANSADIGLDIVHSYLSSYSRVNIIRWNSIGMRSMAVDYSFTGMVTGNNNNKFDTVIVDSPGSGAGVGSVGVVLGQAVPNTLSIFDFASNYFVNCSFLNGVGVAANLRFIDNNTFNQTVFFGATTALKFTAVGSFPASNSFIQSPIIGPIVADPTTFIANGPNWALPLVDGDTPQDIYGISGFLSGWDNVTGRWFGRFRNQPLYYSAISSPAAISNTTAETAFSRSFTIPANVLNEVGTIVTMKAGGRISSTGTPSCTFKFKVGSLTVATFAIPVGNTVTNDAFTLNATFGINTGGVGALLVGAGTGTVGGFSGTNNTVASSTVGAQGIDTTADQALTLTGTWSAASTSNTVTLDNMQLTIEYPGAHQ